MTHKDSPFTAPAVHVFGHQKPNLLVSEDTSNSMPAAPQRTAAARRLRPTRRHHPQPPSPSDRRARPALPRGSQSQPALLPILAAAISTNTPPPPTTVDRQQHCRLRQYRLHNSPSMPSLNQLCHRSHRPAGGSPQNSPLPTSAVSHHMSLPSLYVSRYDYSILLKGYKKSIIHRASTVSDLTGGSSVRSR
ncbi:ribosomal RNA small subunit methyltransferase C [Striga asiatica]|uniref:Ribosomal RNA small subunit methyltransferase C n=1 Tax=Striga asiatica TaxID=4170 RepID=A0A5A7RIW2_STRAF|nr:ribosomal RNA small subunit methyltransferase C [Striga asiatica]